MQASDMSVSWIQYSFDNKYSQGLSVFWEFKENTEKTQNTCTEFSSRNETPLSLHFLWLAEPIMRGDNLSKFIHLHNLCRSQTWAFLGTELELPECSCLTSLEAQSMLSLGL